MYVSRWLGFVLYVYAFSRIFIAEKSVHGSLQIANWYDYSDVHIYAINFQLWKLINKIFSWKCCIDSCSAMKFNGYMVSIETDAATAPSAPLLSQQEQQRQRTYSDTVLDILHFICIKLDYKIRAYAKCCCTAVCVLIADSILRCAVHANKTSIVLAENLITIFVNRDWSCIALTVNFMVFWIIEVFGSAIESSCQFSKMTFQLWECLGKITRARTAKINEAFHANSKLFHCLKHRINPIKI